MAFCVAGCFRSLPEYADGGQEGLEKSMKNGGENTAMRTEDYLFAFYSTSNVKCSTAGGAAKYGPTMLRHSWKAGEPRKSTM